MANCGNPLRQADVGVAFFNEALKHVETLGYIPRDGQILDASIVPAPTLHITKEAREKLESEEIS